MMIKEFSSEEEWVKAAVNFVLSLNPKTVALSGGTTPKPIYRALSEHPAFRDEVDFFLADERCVPITDENSNYKLIKETLNPKTLHTFDTTLDIPESLDLTILGIGEDGHIASLFPHSPALNSKEKTAKTQTENFAVKDRRTLTLKTILDSKNILVLLNNKPTVLNKLKENKLTTEEFPAISLLDHTSVKIFYLS